MRHAIHRPLLLAASAVLVANCSSPTVPGRAARSATSATSSADISRAAGSRDERATPEAARATADVSDASTAEVQAFLAKDPASLARLWSDDFVVTNPFNQFLDKQQVLGLVGSGVLAFSAYQRDIEYAHAYGDIVIVAGAETVVWSGKSPLAGQTSRLRYTAVWARHGDTWQEVARHASMVLPGGPSGPALGG